MAVVRRRQLILSQVLFLQSSIPRCSISYVSAASSTRNLSAASCNSSSPSQFSNEESAYHRRRRRYRSMDSDKSLINHTDSSRSTHPPFSPRALQSSLQTMMIDNPVEKTIRMGMRNSAFLFGEGHRRLRRRQRRRRISSLVSPTVESKKLQMYLTCFAIVFAW